MHRHYRGTSAYWEVLQHFNPELLWVPHQLKGTICDGSSWSLPGFCVLGGERKSGRNNFMARVRKSAQIMYLLGAGKGASCLGC